MLWEEYKNKFYYYAQYEGKDEDYIKECLSYAEPLFKANVPIIYTQDHLSLLVGYKDTYLKKVSNSQRLFYREFNIQKKRKNEFRKIAEPLPNLKNIQKWILEKILENLESSQYSKAYKKNHSIKDNAKFHRGQKKVLTIDIQDYFGSISTTQVYEFYNSLGYSKSVSVMLANLCTLNNSLPQGAPTSPLLSNLITKRMDKRISSFSSKYGIRYTRYADDLTFSGDFQEGFVLNVVEKILTSEGFKINPQKIRTRKRNQRQEVTGIVVNEKLQTSRNYRRNFRKEMYFIRKYGIVSHANRIGEIDPHKYLYKLIGMANFIININPRDEKVKNELEFLKNLIK